MRLVWTAVLSTACAVGGLAALERPAEACGCVHPPEPVPLPEGEQKIAVAQQGEHIIFEVEEGFVTAHVLIQYAGEPEEFAWMVPVPSVPELSLSPASGFALLDRETAPVIEHRAQDDCPADSWQCVQAEFPRCDYPSGGGCGCGDDGDDAGGDNASFGDASSEVSPDAGGGPPAVEVLDQQIIGSYETIVFSAGEAAAAVEWLRTEGFIVNESMAPFMQPYADAGMFFLASKLVAGAETSEIKPLRIRYATDAPMIPLRLTAVAAEPNMGITAYIYGDSFYVPAQFQMATIDESRLSTDSRGRSNYPMVLTRAVKEAGGKSFVREFEGPVVRVDFDQGTGCCNSPLDICGIEGDGVCSCPDSPFDAGDCDDAAALVEGADFVNALADRHSHLTRLTTRMSAENMSYDPFFIPSEGMGPVRQLSLSNPVHSLDRCVGDILEMGRYQDIVELRDCATTYCGEGTCVITELGAGCECEQGTTGRMFTDLDGKVSLTCVPEVAPVDFGLGGLELPDVCAEVDCGTGSCLDVGGFATCQCDEGSALAREEFSRAPTCRPVLARSDSPGADDFTAELADLEVCAPAPPVCGRYEWLEPVRNLVGPRGTLCPSSFPAEQDRIPVDPPSCEELGLVEPQSGCTAGRAGNDAASFGLSCVFLSLFFRRRRSTRRPGRRPR